MASRTPIEPDAATRTLARGAIAKHGRGEKATREEAAAEAQARAWAEEQSRLVHYRTVPKRHLCRLFDRQTKVLHEWADRYGFPFRGETLDLFAVCKAISEYLSRNKYSLPDGSEDPLLAGASQALKDEYVRAQIDEKKKRAALLEIEIREREDRLVSREEIHAGLGRIAAILRDAGEKLQRKFGPEAHRLLSEALDDAIREMDGTDNPAADDSDDAADALESAA
ncbi:MAG: hypothetical protein IMZ55_02425 [Acidobacteria bacterium]|nr:hypothetical protein [Acidobacteriota bacterium]